MKIRLVGIIITLSVFLFACKTTENTATSMADIAAVYNPSEYSINADYRVYHISDEMSTLYVRLFPSELLFNQANDENEYRALVKLEHSLFKLDENGRAIVKIDSATNLIKLGQKEKERSAFLTSLLLPIPAGNRYLLKMEITDIQRGTLGLKHLSVDKTSKYNAQNFSVVSASNALPKFMDYQHVGEVFSIRYREPGVDSIYLTFFKDEYELPRPPVRRIDVNSFPVIVDKTIALPSADSVIYTLPGEGMYLFRIDTTVEEGLTLFNFGDNYPKVETELDMAESLFYIAYPVEYSELMESNGSKIELDNFWLRRSSNVDRSRELIRIYYNRVLFSNIFFTADREGWKTDRGLVYILFGPPDRMKDSGTSQTWYYLTRKRNQVVEFKFNRGNDIYTRKGFYLEKSQYTVRYLDDAIRSWNRGKVHSLKH